MPGRRPRRLRDTRRRRFARRRVFARWPLRVLAGPRAPALLMRAGLWRPEPALAGGLLPRRSRCSFWRPGQLRMTGPVIAQRRRARDPKPANADGEDIIGPLMQSVTPEAGAEPARVGGLNKSQLQHDAVLQERPFVHEPLGSDFRYVAGRGHEAIHQLKVGCGIKQVEVAVLTRKRKPEQLICPAAEDPGLDPGDLEAANNLIDECQVVGPSHDQRLYLAANGSSTSSPRITGYPCSTSRAPIRSERDQLLSAPPAERQLSTWVAEVRPWPAVTESVRLAAARAGVCPTTRALVQSCPAAALSTAGEVSPLVGMAGSLSPAVDTPDVHPILHFSSARACPDVRFIFVVEVTWSRRPGAGKGDGP
jgi:hypothetical protein